MEIDIIKRVILDELNGKSGLYSLKLQNHIYGCFVIMEDIAQKQCNILDTELIYPDDTRIDYDIAFSKIGLQYGFVTNEKLEYDTFSATYKQLWIDLFRDIDLIQDITFVDNIEDSIIDILRDIIPSEDNFFKEAVDDGQISEKSVQKIIEMLSNKPNTDNIDSNHNKDSPTVDEPIITNEVTDAAAHEKVLKSHKKRATRRKHIRRSTPCIKKKLLGITHRKHRY